MKMKKGEQALRILLTAGLLAVIFLFLSPVGRFSVHMVLSGSMEPKIRTGGIVITDSFRKKPITGDVITYRHGDSLVTHRVVGMQNGLYKTKGDANEGEDTFWVYPGQIIGTVVLTLPFLGYLAAFLQKKTVFGLIALMLIQEFIFCGIHWKGERRKTARKQI